MIRHSVLPCPLACLAQGLESEHLAAELLEAAPAPTRIPAVHAGPAPAAPQLQAAAPPKKKSAEELELEALEAELLAA